MNKELSNPMVCICMRNGVEIWIEASRAIKLMNLLESSNPPQFITFENRFINRADLVGIFTASDMEDVTRKKNGQWKCDKGTWHDKGERCECRPSAERELIQKRYEAYTACGKCDKGLKEIEVINALNGHISKVMVACECQRPFLETK